MPDLVSRLLLELAQALRERQTSVQELIEAAIARHERYGERPHAYSLWAPEQARQTGKAADAAFCRRCDRRTAPGRADLDQGPVRGRGLCLLCRLGRWLPAIPWEKDGPIVATLRRQLGVIMGKTHVVEFAFGGTGHNSHWGTPCNPWDATAHRSNGRASVM